MTAIDAVMMNFLTAEVIFLTSEVNLCFNSKKMHNPNVNV